MPVKQRPSLAPSSFLASPRLAGPRPAPAAAAGAPPGSTARGIWQPGPLRPRGSWFSSPKPRLQQLQQPGGRGRRTGVEQSELQLLGPSERTGRGPRQRRPASLCKKGTRVLFNYLCASNHLRAYTFRPPVHIAMLGLVLVGFGVFLLRLFRV